MESLFALHEENSAKLSTQLTKLARKLKIERSPNENDRDLIERVRGIINGDWTEEPPTNRSGHVYDELMGYTGPSGPKKFVPTPVDATGMMQPKRSVGPVGAFGPKGSPGPTGPYAPQGRPSGVTGVTGVTGPQGWEPEDLHQHGKTPMGDILGCWKAGDQYSIDMEGTKNGNVKLVEFDGEKFLYPASVKEVWAPFRPLEKIDIPDQIRGRSVRIGSPADLFCYVVCRRKAWEGSPTPSNSGADWMESVIVRAIEIYDEYRKDPFWDDFIEQAVKTFHVGRVMKS